MTKIIIEGVHPDKMRLMAYHQEGCGDWFFDANGDLRIQIACSGDMNPWDDEGSFLIALHELVEARLCFKDCVTQGAVDNFDSTFDGEGEPGDDASAPYQKQHRAAMMIEHMMAIFLGKWDYGTVK